jgi:hypothetical protein
MNLGRGEAVKTKTLDVGKARFVAASKAPEFIPVQKVLWSLGGGFRCRAELVLPASALPAAPAVARFLPMQESGAATLPLRPSRRTAKDTRASCFCARSASRLVGFGKFWRQLAHHSSSAGTMVAGRYCGRRSQRGRETGRGQRLQRDLAALGGVVTELVGKAPVVPERCDGRQSVAFCQNRHGDRGVLRATAYSSFKPCFSL